MIDEHAGELALGKRPFRQRAGHGGIDASGEAGHDLALPHLRADVAQHAFDHVLGAVIALAAADAKHEVAQNGRSLHGVAHLGVELHAVNALFRAGEGGHGAMPGAGVAGKALGHLRHAVGVVHENHGLGGDGLKKPAAANGQLGVAVLAGVGVFDRAAEDVVDQLHAVADAQHRHAEGKQLLAQARRALLIDAVGAAGEDDAAQVIACPRLHGRGVVHDLAVDAGFAHAAGDELVVLTAEIENDYLFQHVSSSARRMAAPIRPMNRGCGRLGRDLNSG